MLNSNLHFQLPTQKQDNQQISIFNLNFDFITTVSYFRQRSTDLWHNSIVDNALRYWGNSCCKSNTEVSEFFNSDTQNEKWSSDRKRVGWHLTAIQLNFSGTWTAAKVAHSKVIVEPCQLIFILKVYLPVWFYSPEKVTFVFLLKVHLP